MEDPKQLNVFHADRQVGILRLEHQEMKFAYAREWLDDERSFPISLSLPLAEEPPESYVAHHFFANLLPEAAVRQRICAKLKISPGSDFGLLAAIGGDCAGALTITAGDHPPQLRSQNYRPISQEQLAAWSHKSTDVFSDVTGQDGVRLSLAGAQDKLPVHIEGEQFFLPEGDAPSTYLLKFDSPYCSHLPENETYTTMLAKAVGLPVVNVRLQATDQARITVIERYDRYREGACWLRLHQEDMCQALGVSPLNKYEKEGGPQLSQCCEVIQQHCSLPALELDKFLGWMIFNLLAGNCDAHAKNISLLFQLGAGITLAPFYDLVCTRNYENLDRNLAMGIGGETDPGQVGRRQLQRQAELLGVGGAMLLKSVESMAASIGKQLDAVCEEFAKAYGDSPILERLPIKITQQIRRTLRQMQVPS